MKYTHQMDGKNPCLVTIDNWPEPSQWEKLGKAGMRLEAAAAENLRVRLSQKAREEGKRESHHDLLALPDSKVRNLVARVATMTDADKAKEKAKAMAMLAALG